MEGRTAMGLKSLIAGPYARLVTRAVMRRAMEPVATQERVLKDLVAKGASTEFGREHKLAQVRGHADLVDAVPLRDYEGLKPWIDRLVAGERTCSGRERRCTSARPVGPRAGPSTSRSPGTACPTTSMVPVAPCLRTSPAPVARSSWTGR